MLKLSGGQQRRLDVAIALAGDPELLFLDEPTTGFDPSARHAAWDIIKSLTALGKTVFLTTHFMDEAQFLADRLAVLARGEIVAEGTPATIAGRDRMMARIQFRVDGDGADLPSLGQERDERGTWTIRAEDPTAAAARAHRLGDRARRHVRRARGHAAQPRGRLPRDHGRGGGRG